MGAAANGSIKTDLFILKDGFPGVDVGLSGIQIDAQHGDWFAGPDAYHNVAAPRKYELGEKLFVYMTGALTDRMLSVYSSAGAHAPGWSSFTYLRYLAGTTMTAGTLLDICVPAPSAVAGTVPLITEVTNDAGVAAAVVGGPAAICLGNGLTAAGTMTDGYCGWFWTGGVVPVEIFPWLGLTASTYNYALVLNNACAAGPITTVAAYVTAGYNFALTVGAAAAVEAGWALAAGTVGTPAS